MGFKELLEKTRENGCDTSIEIKRSVKNEESIEIVIGDDENRRKRAMDRLREDYSAVELADKSLSEIIEVMGGDFEVDNGQKHLIHYTSPPARNIYNDETLPGFVFFAEPKEGVAYDQLAEDTDFDGVKADVLSGKLEIAFIGLFDNAKYDENISVGMSYVDISEATGSYELALVAGSSAMRQAIAYTDNRKTPGATVYYEYTEGLKMGIKDGFGVYDEEEAKKYDPNSWGIVVFPDK